MSYEGYEQCICANGHLFTRDALGQWENDTKCYTCNAEAAWVNCVDQTNGGNEGDIPYEVLEKFIITPEVREVCNLGHSHLVKEAIYRVPTRVETEPLRVYSEDVLSVETVSVEDTYSQ